MKGVLLVNIGTPDSPKSKDVAKYLKQFLMDEEVIRLPYPLRWLLVNGIIVPFRSQKSAKLYQSIWENNNSPLRLHLAELTHLVKSFTVDKKIVIRYAMRYGQPTLEECIDKMHAKGINDLLVILMFPQQTGSTVFSSFKYIEDLISTKKYNIESSYIYAFYQDEFYQDCLVKSINNSLYDKENYNKLLFTYHGVPLSHLPCPHSIAHKCNEKWYGCIWKGERHENCYRYQCYETTKKITDKLDLSSTEYETVFQSRLGKSSWLKPYLNSRLKELPEENIRDIAIIAPSFTQDCLETLHEIKKEGQTVFQKAGGNNYLYIPCLNDDEDWAFVISQWINCWSYNSKY
ncbi:MAG: ferrochelatase [Bacteroidales bacterium]